MTSLRRGFSSVANERTILCGELASGSSRVKKSDVLTLRMSGPHHNVHLRIEDILRGLTQDIPDQWIDLIEIATYVYVADQAITRGGNDIDEIGANWRRRLHFQIPVRCPNLWSTDRVINTLRETLSFLSEDEYDFQFQPLKKPPTLERYLKFSKSEIGDAPEEVVLFSGGLDSLGGAVQEAVIGDRRVLLVRHRPTKKLETRQRILRQLLAERAAERAPLHITVDINKTKGLNREFTQRTRSFLYASLASTIAKMCGISSIRFFENGIVSLNLPISHQVVGARATRTTHPRVLKGFSELFSLVADENFTVDNGFLWKTKADVAKLIADAGCGNMIEWSQSCTHTWEWTKEHPHCGTCSQCIDRRFAVLATGLDSCDPGDHYRIDLLAGPRDEGEARTLLASYVDTALNVAQMSELEFFCQFGEVGRILGHLAGSRDEIAKRIYKLYRQHGDEVAKVIDDGIVKYSSQIRKRELPQSCLLRLVYDPSVPGDGSVPVEPRPAKPTQAVDVERAGNLFVQRGQAWVYRFNGKGELILLPSRGAAYLHIMLSSPGKRLSATDMAYQVAKNPDRYQMSDAGEAFDKQALVAYRARYEELQDSLDKARTEGDDVTIDKVNDEMKHFVAELKKVGLGGRIKREKSTRIRVSKAVSNAIMRAITQIGQDDADLSEHLRRHVRRGFHPIYDPPVGFVWET